MCVCVCVCVCTRMRACVRAREGGCCNPSPVWSRDETLENLGYFVFLIAHNIVFEALQ